MLEHKRRFTYIRFAVAIAIVLVSLGYLAFTGVQQSKSYYVTIKELRDMNDTRYAKRLRVAGNVVPGSIKRQGSHVEFALKENELSLPVVYNGSEAPPDTFKDDSQAMAEGRFGRDGVFHANQLQAKCASKYAPAPGEQPGAQPTNAPAKPLQKAEAGGAATTGLAQ
jgi:cytochrome c-type biogenesis protein CcmE